MAIPDGDMPAYDFLPTAVGVPVARSPIKQERLIAGAAAYGSQLAVFPEAFIGGSPTYLKFDATNSTVIDGDLQKYYASAIDAPAAEAEN
uniref:CN hydrolase domain-containing protein n=1 Tax=Salix viminalis TaxID=40686 RepID=A0A6N2KJX0_SALVM